MGDLVPGPGGPHGSINSIARLTSDVGRRKLRRTLIMAPSRRRRNRHVFHIIVNRHHLTTYGLTNVRQIPYIIHRLSVGARHRLVLIRGYRHSSLAPLRRTSKCRNLLSLNTNINRLTTGAKHDRSFIHNQLEVTHVPTSIHSKSRTFTRLSLSRLSSLTRFRTCPSVVTRLTSVTNAGG